MKTGIIGKGNFSGKVLKHLRSLDIMTVSGGLDSLSLSGYDKFEKAEDLMDHCDAILILDPIASDFNTISELARAGKHLYIESPGLCNRNELRQLELLSYESDIVLQIGLKQRYYPFYADLKKYKLFPRIIDSNRFVKFNKNSTQLSVIDDLMLHDIDICLKIAASEVKSIYATAVGVYYKAPDVVNARIEFHNGCVANLSSSKISDKNKHEIKFFENNTYCSIDFIGQIVKVQRNIASGKTEQEEQWGVKTVYNQSKDSDAYISILENELRSFYHCITLKTEPEAGISQYLQLKSVKDKIKEQLERNFITKR